MCVCVCVCVCVCLSVCLCLSVGIIFKSYFPYLIRGKDDIKFFQSSFIFSAGNFNLMENSFFSFFQTNFFYPILKKERF